MNNATLEPGNRVSIKLDNGSVFTGDYIGSNTAWVTISADTNVMSFPLGHVLYLLKVSE